MDQATPAAIGRSKVRVIKRQSLQARQAELAIIIPVFKHSAILAEALTTALSEARKTNGILVIVNDGCPYPETHQVCLAWAQAHPLHVEYLRFPNSGLSAARNRGIGHVLEMHPSVEAIYMLDADNRLSPGAMRRALATLRTSGADWVYPAINKFGLEWSGDYSAPYSAFRHLFQNICEAGSLISRRVFEAGIRFDETMRSGYEDWDFWLQCLSAGFRGAPEPYLGFQYRARRESMLRNSERDEATIRAYMQKKHKRLYAWNNVLALEHEEAPRFCIIEPEHGTLRFTSSASEAGQSFELAELPKLFWRQQASPDYFHFPNFTAVGDASVLHQLKTCGVLDWVFWQIEDCLERRSIVAVRLAYSNDKLAVTVHDHPNDWHSSTACVLAITHRFMEHMASDATMELIDAVRTGSAAVPLSVITVALPASMTSGQRVTREITEDFLTIVKGLRDVKHRLPSEGIWEWRAQDALIASQQLFRHTRQHIGAIGAIASAALKDNPEIAFLLPMVLFGGVEQAAVQVARQFRQNGWRTRLVVTGSNEIPAPQRLMDAFDSVFFLNDPQHSSWNRSGLKYFGQDLQRWATNGRQHRLLGLVAGCEAVMTCQAMHGNEIMGWLQRQGVVTINAQHLVDRDDFQAPQGHLYLMLPYEHAYDLITVPSVHLHDVCRSLGVPAAKLLMVANAPTFEPTPEARHRRTAQLEEECDQCEPSRSLRVLALGRLDRQKGIDRLHALVRACRVKHIDLHWRLVGGQVLGQTMESPAMNAVEELSIEPPIYDRAGLIEALLWADVIIMMSRWEGSPISILEAQYLGTIPIVTNVGAVSEMIEDGVDGIILPNVESNVLIHQAANMLEQLSDPEVRSRIARAAMDRSAKLNWSQTTKELVLRVSQIAKDRQDREVR